MNTNISAGEKSLQEIIAIAKKSNIDFIVVSDQYLVRCEYGLVPFRNIFCFSKERRSVSSFGIENYLELIKRSSQENPSLIIIPGLDVAPHYFWDHGQEVIPVCRQFSQQLTVFGEIDSDYIRSMPIIHNYKVSMDAVKNLKKISPSLLLIISLILLRKRQYYDDAQGNKYYKTNKLRIGFAFAIFAISILWTLDNQPFIERSSFTQYKDYGIAPYQALIDHAKIEKGKKIGIVWSAPEAKSLFKIQGIKFLTEKYAHVINLVNGHNGFAGLYGDARTAHLPGREWDQALLQFCEGERDIPPFAFGELDYKDYHGVSFDYIKTVVFLRSDREKNQANIFDAMIKGQFYAVAKNANNEIIIEDFSVSTALNKVISGELISIPKTEKSVNISIKGFFKVENTTNDMGELRFIINGKELASKRLSDNNFSIENEITKEALPQKMNYVRFMINSQSYGEVLSNPIFIRFEP